MELPQYSILMSVYYKDNPDWFKQAIESMLNQTILSNDFVIVCDGPLTEELYKILNQFAQVPDNNIHVVQLEKNSGLGNALNVGLKNCKNEIVARMDSDDISKPDRCEKELIAIVEKNVDIVSTGLEEFIGDISNIVGKRVLPEENAEILKYSKRRSPFNHACVMYKKTSVLMAGNYSEKFHYLEDYYLWVRMLMNKSVGANISESLYLVRTTEDMYKRRGGKNYAKTILEFNRWMKANKWISWKDYCFYALPHAFVCILPSKLLKIVYQVIHHI